MGSSANLLARISADASPFTRAIGEVNAALDSANRKAQATSSGFRAFGESLASIGSTLALGITAPVVAIGVASVSAATRLDSLKRGLATVTGGAAETAREFKALQETAKLPGLSLEDAVRGSIRLQTLGTSATEARRIMANLGNAISITGGTKADFGEVIRQLSQLAASGKVTKENLDPITERIPAISAIIKEKFGVAALGNPAKVFADLGISSEELIKILTDELERKLPKSTGSAQTALENFQEAIQTTAGKIGDQLLPTVIATLPKIEKLAEGVSDAVGAFARLPQPVREAGLLIGGIAVAAGPALILLGQMAQAVANIRTASASLAAVNLGGAISNIAFALTNGLLPALTAVEIWIVRVVGTAAGILSLAFAFERLAKALGDAEDAIAEEDKARILQLKSIFNLENLLRKQNVNFNELAKSYTLGKISVEAYAIGLSKMAVALRVATGGTEKKTAAIIPFIAKTNEASAAVAAHREKVVSSYEEDFKTAVLKERLSLLQSDYTKRLNDGVIALVKYKDAAGAAAAALTELRITETAPELKGAAFPSVRNLPRPTGLPGLPTRSNDDILNEAQNRASGKRNVDIVRENMKDAIDVWKQAQAKMRQAVSTITTDFSRGIADIITNGGKIGDLFAKLGKQIANTLIRTVIEGGINQVTKSLGDLLVSLGGVGAKVGVLFGGAANSAGTIFSAGSSSAGSVASAAGSIGSAGASAAGSASGSIGSSIAAANPATAIVTAVAGVVTALSSVVANFQFSAMNKSLDLIEREVRYSQIHLLYILEKMNQYLPKLADIHQRLVEIIVDGVKVRGGGEGLTVNITVNGSMIGGPNVAAELSQMVVSNLKLQGIRA